MSCTLLKITGPYYSWLCIAMCARINVDLATTFTFRRVEYFLEVEVDRVRDWKENPIRPDVMYFLLSGDKRACIGMRAIGAAPQPCIVHRYARYARLGVHVELAIDEVWPEKSTGLEKRRRLKDSGRSPDTYIYREWQNPKPTRRCGARSSSPQPTWAMSLAICHVLNSMNWETQNTSSWRVLKLHSRSFCPGLFCTSLLRNLLTTGSQRPGFARVITSLPRTAQTKHQIHNEFQISKLKSFEHFEGEVESWWAVFTGLGDRWRVKYRTPEALALARCIEACARGRQAHPRRTSTGHFDRWFQRSAKLSNGQAPGNSLPVTHQSCAARLVNIVSLFQTEFDWTSEGHSIVTKAHPAKCGSYRLFWRKLGEIRVSTRLWGSVDGWPLVGLLLSTRPVVRLRNGFFRLGRERVGESVKIDGSETWVETKRFTVNALPLDSLALSPLVTLARQPVNLRLCHPTWFRAGHSTHVIHLRRLPLWCSIPGLQGGGEDGLKELAGVQEIQRISHLT